MPISIRLQGFSLYLKLTDMRFVDKDVLPRNWTDEFEYRRIKCGVEFLTFYVVSRVFLNHR